jgi:hypothetical protein
MSGKMRLRTRWLVVAAVLALAQSASVAVQAQFFWNWNQQDQSNRQRSRPQSGGLFDCPPDLSSTTHYWDEPGPSASSALRFLTHDVIKKTSLCWALAPDLCKTNRNCNTSEISI